MEFSKKFLRANSPCADGFRWFSGNVEDGTGCQEALDTLVNAGRVDGACWRSTGRPVRCWRWRGAAPSTWPR